MSALSNGDRSVGQPLRGIVVVDLTLNISGPYGTMILADLGADVWKVERPGGGDDARRMAPVLGDGSGYFYAVNRNKRSVALDLRDRGDIGSLERLLAKADVLVTNWRPQKLEALALDPDAIRERHPHLVYADISAYGNEGPEASRAGYDMTVQARSGVMSVNGEPDGPPSRVGVSILDMGSGIWLALGVLGALLERERSGHAGRVSTSLIEVGAAFMAYDAAAIQITGELPGRRGSGHPAFFPYGVFRCAGDSELALGVGADHIFVRLVEALGVPELARDHRYATNAARVANKGALQHDLESVLLEREATEWAKILSDNDVPADQVADIRQVLDDPQLEVVDMWFDVDVPTADGADGPSPSDRLRVPALPIRYDQSRPPLRFGPRRVGADDGALLSEIESERTEGRIEGLRAT